MEIQEQHSKKCASFKHVFHGDMRNEYPNEMEKCECDGYHTFDELYDHRIRLFMTLCKLAAQDHENEMSALPMYEVWASVQHSDGSTFGDWFVMGVGKETGKQITYHLPARFWNEVCEFAEILEKAPEFDGHTSDDVLERLKTL